MIIKLTENKYVDWSNVTDSPRTSILNKEEMIEYFRNQEICRMGLHNELEGDNPDDELRKKSEELISLRIHKELERIEDNGTRLRSILSYNRAGEKETHLDTLEKLIEVYTWTSGSEGKFPWK